MNIVLLAMVASALADSKCAEINGLSVGESCRTAKGVLVQSVKRGETEGVVISGRFWSKRVTWRAYQEGAVGHCRERGLILPTKYEFETLWEAFGGSRELEKVMPDAIPHSFHSESAWFWTRTHDSGNPDLFWQFNVEDGKLVTFDQYYLDAVMCIDREQAKLLPPR